MLARLDILSKIHRKFPQSTKTQIIEKLIDTFVNRLYVISLT
jgi:hypothetical protein